MKLSEIAPAASLDLARDGAFESLGVLSHQSAKMLVALYDPAYLDELLHNENIACVITRADLVESLPERLAVAVSSDPSAAFYRVHGHLLAETEFYWAPFATKIAPDAHVHERAYVAPWNVRIGPGCVIEPNATVLPCSILGKNVILRAGVVVGGEGFEPKNVGGEHIIVPHAGGVRLGDAVEVQPNSSIQRALFGGFTEVGGGTKIGALVDIGHHVRIGVNCEIGACSKICGSTTIEDMVWVGPNATVSNELHVGEGAYVTLGSVVTRDVDPGQRVTGNFAVDHPRFISFIKSIR